MNAPWHAEWAVHDPHSAEIEAQQASSVAKVRSWALALFTSAVGTAVIVALIVSVLP